jgi:hypothetical protein
LLINYFHSVTFGVIAELITGSVVNYEGQLGLIYRQRFVVSVSGFKAGGMERAGWMVNAGGVW